MGPDPIFPNPKFTVWSDATKTDLADLTIRRDYPRLDRAVVDFAKLDYARVGCADHRHVAAIPPHQTWRAEAGVCHEMRGPLDARRLQCATCAADPATMDPTAPWRILRDACTGMLSPDHAFPSLEV